MEQMAFTLKTLNAFEMTKRPAACEIPATRLGHRGFVGVYSPLPERNIQAWRVRKFEIAEGLIEKNFGEHDLVDSVLLRFDTLELVEEALIVWNVDSAALDAPWKSDYPL